jgi:HemY protein
MKFSIIVVIATLVFAFAAHFLLQDPGYVAINFRGYLVEMSVPVLLGIAIVLVVAVWAIRKLIIAPRMIGEAAGRYRAGRAGQKMMRGMIEVAEGNFARGEKLLARAASTSDAPLFNYLQAARAAHLQGNDQRRDEWLKLAYEHTPAATNAVLLTQAELQLDRDTSSKTGTTLDICCRGSRPRGASPPIRSANGRSAYTASTSTAHRMATCCRRPGRTCRETCVTTSNCSWPTSRH